MHCELVKLLVDNVSCLAEKDTLDVWVNGKRVPTTVSTPISLKYKVKSDEWSKDDFDIIRNMQVSYFSMPLGITGLAVAFKIASRWSELLTIGLDVESRSIIVPQAWFQYTALVGAVVFALFLMLYAMRACMYPHKIETEWNRPLRSPSFGIITIIFMLFAFLLYDQIDYDADDEEAPNVVARIFYWIGGFFTNS